MFLLKIFIADDNVMMEARNLRNMSMVQTPLLGDENTPVHLGPGGGTGFESATPRHQVGFTPNPLATPRDVAGTDVAATPGGVAGTPLRTPLRDNLSINPEDYTALAGQTPRLREMSARRALKAGFMSLPKPENNFELLVPDDEEAEGEGAGEAALSVQDAADRDAAIKRRQEEEERKALARRSQAVQRGLPRPANVDVSTLLQNLSVEDEEEEDRERAAADKLITAELAQLLQHDALAYPLPGTMQPGATQSSYVMPDDDALAVAAAEIHLELASLVGFPSASPAQLKDGLLKIAKTEPIQESSSWATVRASLAYDPASKRFVDPATLTVEARAAGYASLLETRRAVMAKEAAKAAKSEKKLGVVLGGYQARGSALSARLTAAFADLQKSKIEYESFARLRANEAAVGPRRAAALQEEVERLETRERGLQMRYKELVEERAASEARVTRLEEKVMEEAEAFNEAQLAAMED
jgi:pre-mRNA-splicing factor CDC5/CEF1